MSDVETMRRLAQQLGQELDVCAKMHQELKLERDALLARVAALEMAAAEAAKPAPVEAPKRSHKASRG